MATNRILKQEITGPEAWLAADFKHGEDYCRQLNQQQIDALHSAVQHLAQTGLKFPGFHRDDFPLPGWQELIQDIQELLERGRGFVLLRGVQLDDYSEAEINALYFGIGMHLGLPVRQNPQGDFLGRVMNTGDITKADTRVYETNAHLPFHTDPSDVFGLLCVRQARQGGMNSLVSVASVYNRLLQTCPEYLGLFYRRVYYAHLGEDLPSLTPLFSYHQGRLSCRYLRQYIELGHEIMGLPLSQVEIDALDAFDAITNDADLQLDLMLQPGDLLFANNYTILHSRTGFEDHDEPWQRRKLLRLWLKMSNARPLAPDFPGRNGFPEPEITPAPG